MPTSVPLPPPMPHPQPMPMHHLPPPHHPPQQQQQHLLHAPLVFEYSGASSVESPDMRALSAGYEGELARMQQVVQLLAHWVPLKPERTRASADASPQPPSDADSADELVRSFQLATATFRRDVLEWPEASVASSLDNRHGYVPSPQPHPPPLTTRVRMCEGIVTLSLTHNGESARSHSPAMAAAGASPSAAGTGSTATRIAPLSSPHTHPLLNVLTRFVLHVVDTLCLNALEVSVLSLYLDRLAPAWATQLERGPGAPGGKHDTHNSRLLHYVAYMAKLSFSDSPTAGTPSDPLHAYLSALWPDFSLHLCTWLHYRGAKQLPTPPVQLNNRFQALATFAAAITLHAPTTQQQG